jgi:hypothetical protein
LMTVVRGNVFAVFASTSSIKRKKNKYTRILFVDAIVIIANIVHLVTQLMTK